MGLTSGESGILLPTRFPFIETTRFFDDIELLRQRWQSANTETVAELYAHHLSSLRRCDLISLARLIDFFKYFSREFSYGPGVTSIRAGLLKKESKGWLTDVSLVVTFLFHDSHRASLIQ